MIRQTVKTKIDGFKALEDGGFGIHSLAEFMFFRELGSSYRLTHDEWKYLLNGNSWATIKYCRQEHRHWMMNDNSLSIEDELDEIGRSSHVS